jgi:hypothetical protein
MRIRLGMTAIVGAIFALVAPAQTVSHQHKRGIFFPIPTERLNNLNPRPTKIRLWTAAPGQKWRMARDRPTRSANGQRPTWFRLHGGRGRRLRICHTAGFRRWRRIAAGKPASCRLSRYLRFQAADSDGLCRRHHRHRMGCEGRISRARFGRHRSKIQGYQSAMGPGQKKPADQ